MIPLVLMGAAAQTPSCVEQHPANEPSVTAAKTTGEDLSLYRPEDLEVYQARCDQEIKAAIDRGDSAGVHSWARTLGEFRHWAADLMAKGVGTTKPSGFATQV